MIEIPVKDSMTCEDSLQHLEVNPYIRDGCKIQHIVKWPKARRRD